MMHQAEGISLILTTGEAAVLPMRLITLIEAPFAHASGAIEAVAAVSRLVRNGWVRMIIVDPQTAQAHIYQQGQWSRQPLIDFQSSDNSIAPGEACA